MIEMLNGMFETINYADQSVFRLHQNKEAENYPEHWHTGIEVIMPLENWYKVYVDKKLYVLQPGEILFIGSCELHSLEAPSSGLRLILQFNLSVLYNLKGLDTALFTLPPAVHLTPENSPQAQPKIRQLIEEIRTEYNSDNPLKEAAIYSKLIEIYVILYRNNIYATERFSDVKSAKQHEYIDKFMSVCGYINDHYSEDLTLESVADVAGFSKFHFSRLFKKFSNITFYDYLCRKRIMEAEKLLLNPNNTVTEVAMATGFNSISTFNRVFKSIKKCSPTEYINRVRHNTTAPVVVDPVEEFDQQFKYM